MSKRVYQVFCGRWEQANVLAHPGVVLKQLLQYDWSTLRDSLHLTHIYLLGLWDTTGPIVVQEEGGVDIHSHANRCASPFAITHHTMVDPLLGTDDDLTALIRMLHGLELKVIVDLVPNHTGLAHPWVEEHPEYYKDLSKTAFSGDVVELNYEVQAVRDEMCQVMRTLVSFGVDGLRCDMAHLVPSDFWKESIRLTRLDKPDVVLIAEAYPQTVFDMSHLYQLMDAGFDVIYDEPLYRNLVAFSKGAPIEYVWGHMEYVRHNNPENWLHYISNHDDPCPFEGDDVTLWQHRLFELPGWQLLYNGTLDGHRGRLAHHYVDIL